MLPRRQQSTGQNCHPSTPSLAPTCEKTFGRAAPDKGNLRPLSEHTVIILVQRGIYPRDTTLSTEGGWVIRVVIISIIWHQQFRPRASTEPQPALQQSWQCDNRRIVNKSGIIGKEQEHDIQAGVSVESMRRLKTFGGRSAVSELIRWCCPISEASSMVVVPHLSPPTSASVRVAGV